MRTTTLARMPTIPPTSSPAMVRANPFISRSSGRVGGTRGAFQLIDGHVREPIRVRVQRARNVADGVAVEPGELGHDPRVDRLEVRMLDPVDARDLAGDQLRIHAEV